MISARHPVLRWITWLTIPCWLICFVYALVVLGYATDAKLGQGLRNFGTMLFLAWMLLLPIAALVAAYQDKWPALQITAILLLAAWLVHPGGFMLAGNVLMPLLR